MFRKLFAPFFYISNWWLYYEDFFGIFQGKIIFYKLKGSIKLFALPKTFDSRIINEIWGEKVYLLDRLDMKNMKTIVDIGAHKGYFSILAASKAKNSKIISVEPLPENFAILKKNIAINKMKNIKPYNVGLSNKNEKRNLYASRVNSGGFTMIQDWFAAEKEVKSITVQCVTLESLLKKEKVKNIDLFKIDVEGAEYAILNGFSVSTFKKIKNITMEFHQIGNLRVKDIIKLLKKNNFEVTTTPVSQTIGMLYAKNISQ